MKKFGSLLQELMDLTIKHLMIFLFGTLEWMLKTHLKITTMVSMIPPFLFLSTLGKIQSNLKVAILKNDIQNAPRF